MKALPFLFCLLACTFAKVALATVDPSTEAAADRICLTRPSACGIR
jgi:hypothetical protein